MSINNPLDEKLIRLLGQDARQNSEALAKQLNISSATVRRRLRKLLRSKLLRIIAVVDPVKFGIPLAALLTLNVEHDKLESVMKTLAERPEIRWFSTTIGRYNVIALARFSSTDSLSEFTRNVLFKIEGIKDNETFLCLDVTEGTYIPVE